MEERLASVQEVVGPNPTTRYMNYGDLIKKSNRARYARARADKRIAEARELLGGKCTECGTLENLEFDHIYKESKCFTLSGQAGGVSKERWDNEVAKCQLLCRMCHLEKTKRERGYGSSKDGHGTDAAYKSGCRCVECKASKSQRNKVSARNRK